MRRLPKPGSVRNVVTGRSDHYTGRVPFARLYTTVGYDSLLEHDFLLETAAFEPDVTEIFSQPFWVNILEDDQRRIWLPDYLIRRSSGARELVEVKPIEEVRPDLARGASDDVPGVLEATARARERFRALRAAATEDGFQFRLITEQEIRIEPRLGNAALLLRYAGNAFFPADWILETRIALAGGSITCVAELQAAIPEWDAFGIALHLAWAGELELDPTERFSRDSKFVRVGRRLLDPSKASIARGDTLYV
jgi:hypothetical protein